MYLVVGIGKNTRDAAGRFRERRPRYRAPNGDMVDRVTGPSFRQVAGIGTPDLTKYCDPFRNDMAGAQHPLRVGMLVFCGCCNTRWR